jgi:uncharacterized membrane protein
MMSLGVAMQVLKGGGAIGAGGKSFYDGDYAGIAANAHIAVQSFITAYYSRATVQADIKTVMSSKPTAWLEAGLVGFVLAEFVNGISKPDTAAALTAGGATPNFDAAIAMLKLALPDDSQWSGEAAQAYTNAVNKVKDCVTAVQAADQKLQEAVAVQADRVMWARGEFHVIKMGLIWCFMPAYKIYSTAYWAAIAEEQPHPAADAAAKQVTRAFQMKVIKGAFGGAIAAALWNLNFVFDEATAAMSTIVPMYTEAKAKTPLPQARAIPTASAATGGPTTAPTFQRPGGAKPYPVAGAIGGAVNAARTNGPAQPTPMPSPASPAPAGALIPPLTQSAPVTPAASSTTPSVPQMPQPARPPAGAPTATRPAGGGTGTPGGAAEQSAPNDAQAAGSGVGGQGAGRAPITDPVAEPAPPQQPQPASHSPGGRHHRS